MKTIFILIAIVLFNSIISIDIYLNDGIEKTVNNLVANQTYHFYINVTQYQTINVSLISSYMGIKSSPISYTNISEYSDTSSSYIYRNNNVITSSIKDKVIISSFSYIIVQYETKYITLEMVPVYNVDNITIKIDIRGGGYDLVNGVPKNITNLEVGYPYYFFIPATQFQTCSVSLNMSLTDKKPIDTITVLYLSNRISTTYINRDSRSIYLSKVNDEYTSNFKYSISNHNINSFCLILTPKYNITYLTAKIDINGGLYQLSDGSSKSFTSLKAGYEYYYYIPAKKNQMARINLNMSSSSNNNPLSYIYIHEYYNKTFEYHGHRKEIYVTTSNKNNEYFTSFIYSNYENNTEYIALIINPRYNIDLLTSKIDVIDNKYDLSPKNKKTIYNLMSGDVYYFYIDTSENYKIEVTFTSNDYFSLNLKIHELDYSYSTIGDYAYSRRDGYLDSKNNSFTYTSSPSKQKVVIEISPNTDINDISAEFKYPASGLFIFTIILCIFFLVFLIVCLYIRNCRKSKNEFDNSAQSEPLYSANESSNYQQQNIGQPLKNDQL